MQGLQTKVQAELENCEWTIAYRSLLWVTKLSVLITTFSIFNEFIFLIHSVWENVSKL